MSHSPQIVSPLDRYTTMGDFTANVGRMVRKYLPAAGGIFALETVLLFYTGSHGALAFAFIAIGTVIAMATWAPSAKGVPLVPMMLIQNLAVYALPIVSGHQDISTYPQDYVTRAGLEVMIFNIALIFGWRLGMQIMPLAPPRAYALQGIDREGIAGLSRLGFGLASAATAFLVLQSLDLTGFIFDLLPGGSYPIFFAAISAASACGFFLLAMIMGSGSMPMVARIAFWFLMAANCLISASGFLLSASTVVLASVAIGLFWSSGRIPWKFVLLVAVLVSFFNSGKYAMRSRYWESADDEITRPSGLLAMPTIYSEWTQASLDAIVGGDSVPAGITGLAPKKNKQQGLLERLNNLQNLLYVIDAMDTGRVPALGGETYAVIPKLLIPRIIWPGKPRTHEGQVLLNTHFGRQDLQSTFKTYVAWGLLAEAYGNFGPIVGVVLLGLALGGFFAWAECFTARKPILSAEGFVAFVVFLGLANSFEMVASVMVTSIFQSIVPVVIACSPFVRYQTVVRPDES